MQHQVAVTHDVYNRLDVLAASQPLEHSGHIGRISGAQKFNQFLVQAAYLAELGELPHPSCRVAFGVCRIIRARSVEAPASIASGPRGIALCGGKDNLLA